MFPALLPSVVTGAYTCQPMCFDHCGSAEEKEPFLCPLKIYDQEGQRLLDIAVIYRLKLMVSKKSFALVWNTDASVLVWMTAWLGECRGVAGTWASGTECFSL